MSTEELKPLIQRRSHGSTIRRRNASSGGRFRNPFRRQDPRGEYERVPDEDVLNEIGRSGARNAEGKSEGFFSRASRWAEEKLPYGESLGKVAEGAGKLAEGVAVGVAAYEGYHGLSKAAQAVQIALMNKKYGLPNNWRSNYMIDQYLGLKFNPNYYARGDLTSVMPENYLRQREIALQQLPSQEKNAMLRYYEKYEELPSFFDRYTSDERGHQISSVEAAFNDPEQSSTHLILPTAREEVKQVPNIPEKNVPQPPTQNINENPEKSSLHPLKSGIFVSAQKTPEVKDHPLYGPGNIMSKPEKLIDPQKQFTGDELEAFLTKLEKMYGTAGGGGGPPPPPPGGSYPYPSKNKGGSSDSFTPEIVPFPGQDDPSINPFGNTRSPLDEPGIGLRAGEMKYAGADFMKEILDDPLLKTENRLTWLSFNNHTWEANEQLDNPLYISQQIDEAKRFTNNLWSELEPEKSRLARVHIKRKADNLKFVPDYILRESELTFREQVPTQGTASEFPGEPSKGKTPEKTEDEFHNAYFPCMYDLAADSPWRLFTNAQGSQCQTTEPSNPLGLSSYYWDSNRIENHFIEDTLS